MKGRVVHVVIHGQRYAVRSDLDTSYVAELATYLDGRMQLAAAELHSADPLRVAVIAALNVVDELFRAQADTRGVEGHVRARTAAIELLVDAALEEHATGRVSPVEPAATRESA